MYISVHHGVGDAVTRWRWPTYPTAAFEVGLRAPEELWPGLGEAFYQFTRPSGLLTQLQARVLHPAVDVVTSAQKSNTSRTTALKKNGVSIKKYKKILKSQKSV